MLQGVPLTDGAPHQCLHRPEHVLWPRGLHPGPVRVPGRLARWRLLGVPHPCIPVLTP